MFNYHLGKCNKNDLELEVKTLKNIIKELQEEHKDCFTLIDHYKKDWEMAANHVSDLCKTNDELQEQIKQRDKDREINRLQQDPRVVATAEEWIKSQCARVGMTPTYTPIDKIDSIPVEKDKNGIVIQKRRKNK